MSQTLRTNHCTEAQAYCRIYSVRTADSININKILLLFMDDGIVEENIDEGDIVVGHQYLAHDFCDGYLKDSIDYMLRRGEISSLLNLFVQLIMSGMDYYRENYMLVNREGVANVSVEILPKDAVRALSILQEEYGDEQTHTITSSLLLVGIGVFANMPPDYYLNFGAN